MSTHTHRSYSALVPFIIAVMLAGATMLAGCDSDDGNDDNSTDPGSDVGATGTTISMTATELNVTFDRVTIESPPVIEFYVENQFGLPFAGMTADNVRFTIAQLDPGRNGEPSAWQSYINQTETAGETTMTQATYEQATAGTFVNHGDGHYTYTFATDITNISSPIEVSYQPTWTHRIAMQFSGLPISNPTYTWQPSTGATSGITSRDIVNEASCNECHGKLAMHGGGRVETKYCVTCHNPGSADANSGNTVDFKVLIHKLHRGANLPSVQAGGRYVIYGHNDSEHDFSDVAFPQDVRNCTKCHDGSDSMTPDGDNWKYNPSAEACGSCHDDVDFTTGTNHPGGVVSTDSECHNCHAPGDAIANVHTIPAKVAAGQFAYTFTEATYDANTGRVTANFRITDPSNSDAPYELTESVWAGGDGIDPSTLRLNIAWDSSSDYTNTGSGNGIARALQIAFLDDGVLDAAHHSYDDSTGVHTVVSNELPESAKNAGSGSVAIEGYPHIAVEGETISVPVTSAVAYFAINDASAVPRRSVVASAKCLSCHDTLALHGNNRVNNVEICVTCHNPNNTDIVQRPDHAEDAVDGKREEAIDFKYLIHSIHAGEKDQYGFREDGIVIYGFRGSVHDFSNLRFPGILNNCETCHDGNTYTLPLGSMVKPTVITSRDDVDPANDRAVTPTAMVCSACHNSSQAKTHMTQNGALFDVPRDVADTAVEVCAVCHGEDRIASVQEVHGVD